MDKSGRISGRTRGDVGVINKPDGNPVQEQFPGNGCSIDSGAQNKYWMFHVSSVAISPFIASSFDWSMRAGIGCQERSPASGSAIKTARKADTFPIALSAP
jgi:hypothetical protein